MTAFAVKYIQERLAKLFGFLAKEVFEFQYSEGSSNLAADFLLRILHSIEGDGATNVGELVYVLTQQK